MKSVAGTQDFQQVTKDITRANLSTDNYALHNIAQAITGMFIMKNNHTAIVSFEIKVGNSSNYGFTDIFVQIPNSTGAVLDNYIFEVKPKKSYAEGREQLDDYYEMLKCTNVPYKKDHTKLLPKGRFFSEKIIETDIYEVIFNLYHNYGDGVVTYEANVRTKPNKNGKSKDNISSIGYVDTIKRSGILSNQKSLHEEKMMKSVDELTARLYGKPLSKMTQSEAFNAGLVTGIAAGGAVIATVSLSGPAVEAASVALTGDIAAVTLPIAIQ